MSDRPYALLTFSFDPQQPLPGVMQELNRINEIFLTSQSAPVSMWGVSQTQIEKNFELYRQDIRIFHFSGHAGPSLLQTNFMGKPRYTFAEGLSKNVGLFGKGLKLVFLNGCSTQEQVDFFLREEGRAVIATRKPVADRYACFFARLFYEKFIGSNLPLADAFEAARNSFDAHEAHGNFCDRLKRRINRKFLAEKFRAANFELEADESPEIYDLHTYAPNSPVRRETFADWFPPAKAEAVTEKVSDPAQLNTGKKDELGYLTCNRETPVEALHGAVVAKTAQPCQIAEPRFFLICDAERHCPQLLPERFERYSLRELFRTRKIPLHPDAVAHCFKELRLPEAKDFVANEAGDGFNDHFKIALSQIFHGAFGGSAPGEDALGRLNPYREPLLVVHHRLLHSDWIDAEEQAKLAALLRHYLGAYADDLQAQLTERLIVVFHLQLILEDPDLQQLFSDLAAEFPHRLEVISGLPEIKWSHVQAWEREFLGVADNTFLEIGKIFTPAGGENKPVKTLPFKSLIGKLQTEIVRYNNTRVNHGVR